MSDIRKMTNNIDLIAEALGGFSTTSPTQDLLFKDKILVDVGCGAGHLTRELTLRGARTIGIDTAEMISKAAEYTTVGNESYLQGGGENIGLENEYADGVIFFASLHHVRVEKMEAAIKECYRVLKKNGLAIFVEPVFQAGSWSELVELLGNEEENQRHAWAAIKNAGQIGFTDKKEERFYFERSLDHFINQLTDHQSDKKKRKKYISEGKKVLAHLSKKANVAPEDYRFKSYCRLNILQKETGTL